MHSLGNGASSSPSRAMRELDRSYRAVRAAAPLVVCDIGVVSVGLESIHVADELGATGGNTGRMHSKSDPDDRSVRGTAFDQYALFAVVDQSPAHDRVGVSACGERARAVIPTYMGAD